MELTDNRPHRSNSLRNTSTSTTTSELFICFSSRLSSSSTSMKLPPSKSLLSPGRPRDPCSQISLSTSLSRRLRTNGSLKGGQASPMFPPSGKKKGCAFENPEPSSPKVTCIGQVRVKSKKQGKRGKKNGVRRRGGEVSFRGVGEGKEEEGQFCNNRSNNGKWVHLPLTICEGLRALGSEINCFSPCRGGNSSGISKDEEEKAGRGGGFCGAVFARWVVDDDDDDDGEGKGREIELVVGDEGEKELERRSYNRRHHVFEEIEFKEERISEGEEGNGRVSICIPPKNALLLMRCRSDPVKLAALASKFLEAPPEPPEEEEQGEEEMEMGNVGEDCVIGEDVACSFEVNEVGEDKEATILVSLQGEEEPMQDGLNKHMQETSAMRISDVLQGHEDDEQEQHKHKHEEEDLSANSFPNEEIVLDPELMEIKLGCYGENEDTEQVEEEEEVSFASQTEPEPEPGPNLGEEDSGEEQLLPDCLLLMMCEPKLSMEVSKETWVCSTDFIRWIPGARTVKKRDGGDCAGKKKRAADLVCAPLVVKCKENDNNKNYGDENERLEIQPPRSSCYYPAQPPVKARGESMASVIGRKLGAGKGYEPFVLTRCKSEPMRTAAAKLVPQEGCFWKNRKLEPAASLGVGAAGVGF